MLDSDGLALHGTATVRNCTGKGFKFQVGLEFSGGMKWKPETPKAEALDDWKPGVRLQ